MINDELFSSLFDGVPPSTKRCSKCHHDKPLGCFSKDSGANYLRSECKECASKHSKLVSELKKTAPPVSKDHCCPGCGDSAEQIAEKNRLKNKKKNTIWVTDHDHTTEQFRDYVCNRCNLALGNAGDDPDTLQRLTDYVRKHKNRLH